MKYLIIAFKLLYRISILKTLWINFRCLPFKSAIKIPIVLGKGTILRDISGRIEINCPIRPGLMTVGVQYIFNDKKSNKSIIDNKGKIVIGGKLVFHTGITLCTGINGIVIFNGNNTLGANSTVFAIKKIVFGKNIQMSWDIQIIDTDFHYIEVIASKTINSNSKMIIIGDNVWIGNHVSISKGSYVPNGSIVASRSLVNKSYENKGENLLLAGAPAKIIKEGVTMVFDLQEEKILNSKFGI